MRVINLINIFIISVIILIFVNNITPLSAGPLEDIQTTIDIKNSLGAGNINEAKELLDELSNRNIRDIWTINILQKIIDNDECTGELEELISDISNQNLRDLWAINALQNILDKDNCDELSLNLHAMVSNEQLKDLWAINIVQRSINDNKCAIGVVAINRVENEILKVLWNQNFEINCGLATEQSNSEGAEVSIDTNKISKLFDEISSRIQIIEWSNENASRILKKLEELNSELEYITKSTESKTQKTIVTGDKNYNLVCVSKDNDGLSPYTVALRDGPVEEKRFLVTYKSMNECDAAIEIQEAEGGTTYVCAPKDNDGLRPFEILIVDFSNYQNRYVKTSVVPGTKEFCNQALNSRVFSKGSDYVCASKDADGLNPFGLFRLEGNGNSRLVGGVFSSFKKCLDSL